MCMSIKHPQNTLNISFIKKTTHQSCLWPLLVFHKNCHCEMWLLSCFIWHFVNLIDFYWRLTRFTKCQIKPDRSHISQWQLLWNTNEGQEQLRWVGCFRKRMFRVFWGCFTDMHISSHSEAGWDEWKLAKYPRQQQTWIKRWGGFYYIADNSEKGLNVQISALVL